MYFSESPTYNVTGKFGTAVTTHHCHPLCTRPAPALAGSARRKRHPHNPLPTEHRPCRYAHCLLIIALVTITTLLVSCCPSRRRTLYASVGIFCPISLWRMTGMRFIIATCRNIRLAISRSTRWGPVYLSSFCFRCL